MPESQDDTLTADFTTVGGPLNRGIVYVLTNQAMDNYVKVGRTGGSSPQDVLARMKQLDNTSVPLPFDCEYAAVVDDFDNVEKALLTAFEDRRLRNREFLYDVAPHRIKAILRLLEIADVTPRGSDSMSRTGSEFEAPEPSKSKKQSFKFSMARVPVGATLQWADAPEITCYVQDDTHVIYEGERATISGIAKDLKGWPSARGSLYWLYGGQTLQELRDQVEAEEG
jgi:hypothetical protein